MISIPMAPMSLTSNGWVTDSPLPVPNNPATVRAPAIAPDTWATQYGTTSVQGKCRPDANASVTAGLMCAPDRWPMAKMTIATTRPQATATPMWPPMTPSIR